MLAAVTKRMKYTGIVPKIPADVANGKTLAEAIADQVDSNRSAIGHETHFGGHRARLTAEIRARAPAGGGGRLCLLGSGNAGDVDLEALAADFAEVHLVDIDAAAVARAVERVGPERRARLAVHAPVDLSGIFGRLDDWSRAPPAASAIADEAQVAIGRVVGALPGPFDVVVSCCLLTQLQLVLLEVAGDAHPRFDELRAAVSAIHVRVVAGLLAPGGVGLLVTDLVGSDTYPLDSVPADANLAALMGELLYVGNVIMVSHPGLLSAQIRRDPALARAYAVRFPVGPWIWHDGPEKTFLVYALEITRAAASD
jgi:hypothetical protein